MKNTKSLKVLLEIVSIALCTSLIVASAVTATEIMIYEVAAGDYHIINKNGGHVIEMDGYGYLMEPGKPRLPSRNFLIALPPGAQVQGVEISAEDGKQIPGTYDILPSPPIILASDPQQYPELMEKLQQEWDNNNTTVYSSDQPYPEKRGKLSGFGTLRKYAYASVTFYPFSYYPATGRLVYYSTAKIAVKYTLPLPGSPEARLVEELKWDVSADDRASHLFINYDQIEGLYVPTIKQSSSSDAHYDFVIITPASNLNVINASDFPGWKASMGYSLKTILTADPEIAGQPGGDLAEQIRNFLTVYYGMWGIEYLLIVGDVSSVPMRICYPDTTDYTYNPYYPYSSGEAVPTDYYYADLSSPDLSSWNSDGDGYYGEYGQDNPDFLAEIYVGRIPTDDSVRILYTLNKLVAFEQDMGSWKSQVLHPGAILFFENQDNNGYPFIDGARLQDELEVSLMSGWTCSHFSEQEGIVISDYAWPALSMASFTDDWRTGQYGIVNWSGHGAPNGVYRTIWWWDDGDGIPETDGSDGMQSIPFITTEANLDDDYPSIMFAVSCNVGYPEPNVLGNLGIDLLTKPGYGAASGVLSSSRPAAISVEGALGGGAEGFCYRFNQFMLDGSDGPEKIGNAFYDAKFYCNQNFGWDHYYEYKNLYNYNLYGDPSMVREGVPASVCGDTDKNGGVNILDITFLISFLYKGGPAPEIMWAADPNGDMTVNILDITYLIGYLYMEGPEPVCQ